jgi:anthranilate/para-aminobenzoate synthase component I
MAVIREVALRPDAIAIARALRDRPGLCVLTSADARFSFIACDPVDASDDLVPTVEAADARGWNGAAPAPRWIGAIPYEAMRSIERAAWTRSPDRREPPPLERPRWRKYDAVLRIDRASGVVAVEADDDRAASRLARHAAREAEPPREFALELSPVSEDPSAHERRVREVLALIAKGDVYQVNLARRLSFAFRGDALEAFVRLVHSSRAAYGFFADLGDVVVCGSSPELALEARGERLRTAPIKGTLPRGEDAAADRARASRLDADAKERAELVMAIDLHRNDLGRVAVAGSVRVLGDPRVIAGPTVWSRVAEIVARRAPGITNCDLARAMLPCGSVTGAPKIRAMEIIATLEPHRRGLYTGAYGYVGRDGALVLAMAIRTLEVQAERAFYWTGGGIVADSDPARELDETRWKASHLPVR